MTRCESGTSLNTAGAAVTRFRVRAPSVIFEEKRSCMDLKSELEQFCDFLCETRHLVIDGDESQGAIEKLQSDVQDWIAHRRNLKDQEMSEIDREASCVGKQGHRDFEGATKAAESASFRKGEPFEAYKCRHCEFFHIGHPRFWSKFWQRKPEEIGNAIKINGISILEFVSDQISLLPKTGVEILCSRCNEPTTPKPSNKE